MRIFQAGCRILLLTWFLWSCGMAQEHARPTVEILVFHPVTTLGETGAFKIISLADSEGKDYSSLCSDGICRGLPKGPYDFVLRLMRNGRELHDKGQFYHSREWVTVFLGPAFGTAGDFDGRPVAGKILGIPQIGETCWVRLQPLYSPGWLETPISESGEFQFESVLVGKWLLLIFQGENVLLTKQYTLGQTADRLEIDLRK